jgi:mono/diheme cytochrome c family protein
VKRLVTSVVLVACGSPIPPDSTDGPALFAAYCALCHGPNGQPPAQMVARLNVKDLTSPSLRPKLTPEFVESQIRNGSQNGLMPPFGAQIHEAQIKAIATWVASPQFGGAPK